MTETTGKRWITWLIGLGIVLTAAAIVGLLYWFKPSPPKKDMAIVLPLVQTAAITPQTMRLEVASQGTVMAKNRTTLVAEVAGVVRHISPALVAGGAFKKNDVLLNIDARDYEVAVQQARASLAAANAKLTEELARAEVARREWEGLHQQGKTPTDLALRKPFVEQAQAMVSSAQADLAAAERKLQRTIIRAPYDGMVMERKVDLGQYLNIGTAMAMVFSSDSAEIRLPVPDADIALLLSKSTGRIAAGKVIHLSAQYGGSLVRWEATLVRAEATVDERNRMHYVVAEIKDPYNLTNKPNRAPLKVGTFVKALIAGNEMEDIAKVPRTLLRGRDEILVADEANKLQIRRLEIVHADRDWLYFRAGTEAGDKVIVSALETPVAGTELRVQSETNEVLPKESPTSEPKP